MWLMHPVLGHLRALLWGGNRAEANQCIHGPSHHTCISKSRSFLGSFYNACVGRKPKTNANGSSTNPLSLALGAHERDLNPLECLMREDPIDGHTRTFRSGKFRRHAENCKPINNLQHCIQLVPLETTWTQEISQDSQITWSSSLLSGNNKGNLVLDMMSSPRPMDCSNSEPFIIKAVKVDPVPAKPLSKYNQLGFWELKAIANLENRHVDAFVEGANRALSNNNPKLSNLGTGGAYFVSNSDKTAAVFKPTDEEPQAPNNPRGTFPIGSVFQEGLKKGTRPGEGAWREYAAYLLDHSSFSGVPLTLMARLDKPGSGEIGKVGSLQQFVHHDYDAEECGTSIFRVKEVHKICILDLRISNTDRNGQNILVSKSEDGSCSLTPIDHGYGFPDCYDDVTFEWMYYKQAEVPFDRVTLDYIEALDPEKDIDFMEKHGVSLRPSCLDLFRFSTYMLKWCAHKGFTAYEIACLMCKDAYERKFDMPHAQDMYEAAKSLAGDGSLTQTGVDRILNAYVATTYCS